MGRATVMRFLADGAKVVVADLNEVNGAETLAVAKANGHGNSIAFVRCDVARESDVTATVAEAEKRFGRLDIAYLNAGVGGAFGPIAETSVEDWDYTFAVLTRSVFLGMKHASQAMKKHGDGGVILVTASIAGMVGGGGSHAYSAAKAAVISLIDNVAAELGAVRSGVVGIALASSTTPLLHRSGPGDSKRSSSRRKLTGTPEGNVNDCRLPRLRRRAASSPANGQVDGGLAQGVARRHRQESPSADRRRQSQHDRRGHGRATLQNWGQEMSWKPRNYRT